MINPDIIDQALTSALPVSIERVAEIMRKALKLYQPLKDSFIRGAPPEQAEARKMAMLIIQRVEEEMQKACETLGIAWHTCEAQIFSYFTSFDIALYQEVRGYIMDNYDKIFVSHKTKHAVPVAAKTTKTRLRC
jgi:hypothetical protein